MTVDKASSEFIFQAHFPPSQYLSRYISNRNFTTFFLSISVQEALMITRVNVSTRSLKVAFLSFQGQEPKAMFTTITRVEFNSSKCLKRLYLPI